MRRSVDLILPDTGPLITLATADRLELLASFGRPVMIPDVIREEATAKPGSPGHDRLTAWFGNAGHNQYRIINTPFIGVYGHLKTQPNHPDGTPAANGMGEATLMWVVKNVHRLHAPDTTCLVLTEDGTAGDQMPDDVHILSTRSWLNGLERLRVIESAQAVITAVEEGGRRASRYSRDQRGRDMAGNRTEWTKSVVLPEEPRARRDSPRAASQDKAAKKEDEDPAAATSTLKILVTKSELARAIALLTEKDTMPEDLVQAGPVVDLLVTAGGAVTFDPTGSGKILHGTDALNALEKGFGSGAYRSLQVDVDLWRAGRPNAPAGSDEGKIRSALVATSERRLPTSNASSRETAKGTGRAD